MRKIACLLAVTADSGLACMRKREYVKRDTHAHSTARRGQTVGADARADQSAPAGDARAAADSGSPADTSPPADTRADRPCRLPQRPRSRATLTPSRPPTGWLSPSSPRRVRMAGESAVLVVAADHWIFADWMAVSFERTGNHDGELRRYLFPTTR